MLGHLRDIMTNEIRRVYDNNYLYIRDLDSIIMKESAEQDRTNRVLDGLDVNQSIPQNFNMGMPMGTSISIPMHTLPMNNIPITRSNIANYGAYIPVNLSKSNANTNMQVNNINRVYGANLQGTISPS